jgi:hypothetical protein
MRTFLTSTFLMATLLCRATAAMSDEMDARAIDAYHEPWVINDPGDIFEWTF